MPLLGVESLLATAIGFAGNVLATILGVKSGQRQSAAVVERVTAEIRTTERSVVRRVSRETYLDRQFIEGVVTQSVEHLSLVVSVQHQQLLEAITSQPTSQPAFMSGSQTSIHPLRSIVVGSIIFHVGIKK